MPLVAHLGFCSVFDRTDLADGWSCLGGPSAVDVVMGWCLDVWKLSVAPVYLMVLQVWSFCYSELDMPQPCHL